MRSVLLTAISVCIALQPASAESVDPAQLYDERYSSGNYSEAAESAKQLVGQVVANGADEIAYADALQKLAKAQQMMGELPAAIENYRSAIGYIESASDMLAYPLVAPLVGLADTLEQNFEYGLAVQTYERAAHVSQVNEGPMNLAQGEILTALVDLYTDQELLDEAVGLQAYQLRIYRRSLEETDPRVLQAWRRNGELLGLLGEHHEAQELYVFAADIIRVADGHDSLAQIALLNDLSESYLLHAKTDQFTRIEMARAELERVVSIIESNADATTRQRADAYLRMGDLMQRYGERNSALYNYRLAWNQVVEDDLMQREMFSEPMALNLPRQDVAADVLTTESGIVEVRVAYDVNHRGHVENVRVQNDPPTEIAAKRALTITRKLVFRPRFEAGDPAYTTDLIRDIQVDSIDRY